jgi:hypothetical protein
MEEKKAAKKKIWNILGIASFLIIILLYAYITWPHHILKEMNGIEYSQEDKDLCVPVSVTIHGTMKQGLTGGRIFTGTIDLRKTNIAFPDQKLTISFDKVDWSSLSFGSLSGEFFDYGGMFADEDMSRVVICEHDKVVSTGAIRSGNILAFPAEERAEAEKLTLDYFKQEKSYYFGN